MTEITDGQTTRHITRHLDHITTAEILADPMTIDLQIMIALDQPIEDATILLTAMTVIIDLSRIPEIDIGTIAVTTVIIREANHRTEMTVHPPTIDTVTGNDPTLRNLAQEAMTATVPTVPKMITQIDPTTEATITPGTDTSLPAEVITIRLVEADTILQTETAIVPDHSRLISKDVAIIRDRHPETGTILHIDPPLARITEANPRQAHNTPHRDQG